EPRFRPPGVQEEGVSSVVDARAEPALTLAQGLLGLLALGDVDACAYEADRPAGVVAYRHTAGQHPAVQSVPVPHPKLDRILRRLAQEEGAQVLSHPLSVVGMDGRHHGLIVDGAGGSRITERLHDVGAEYMAGPPAPPRHVVFPDADVGAAHC